MTLKFPPDYPETFQEFVTAMVPRLTQVLSDEVQASEVAFALVEDLRQAFIGCLLYFPRGTHKYAAERKAAILRDFNGHNYKELSVKYKLTLQYIYQIINDEKKKALDGSHARDCANPSITKAARKA